ncbi:single-stranded DNA-binding protein [Corynebacterium urealyticum]|uniref:single-stranded DNA-binding protein n=1 Tax=Corynebacterium urealyticum TaxID=43771 RepID=UPI00293EF3AE|nr:single-stranded DNA-binding protein [Corynebacterium urealyticum]WOH94947.1 single-stranded DNA-binding protein [Corynebacterium urealyticum]
MALPQITITEATLVADPELRYTNNGTAVANFRVASNSRRKNQQTGQWEDGDTTFLAVSAFGGLGENIAAEFKKGEKITVTGQLKQRDYEKDGQKRTAYEVAANNAAFPVSRFNDNGTNNQQPAQQGFQQAQNNIQSSFGSMEEPPF